MPIIPPPRRLRKKDCYDFEACGNYRVRPSLKRQTNIAIEMAQHIRVPNAVRLLIPIHRKEPIPKICPLTSTHMQ